MSLKVRITDDMKAAMRARETERLSAIRMLLAAIRQREIDERIDAGDDLVMGVVEKLIKQRRDAASQFRAAHRDDLADKEDREIDVLARYLPEPFSEAEVAALIEEAVQASSANGPQDMGKVMGWLKPRLAGRADMGRVSQQIKQRLATA
jgi:uncharacterized protein YqeY